MKLATIWCSQRLRSNNIQGLGWMASRRRLMKVAVNLTQFVNFWLKMKPANSKNCEAHTIAIDQCPKKIILLTNRYFLLFRNSYPKLNVLKNKAIRAILFSLISKSSAAKTLRERAWNINMKSENSRSAQCHIIQKYSCCFGKLSYLPCMSIEGKFSNSVCFWNLRVEVTILGGESWACESSFWSFSV